MLSLAVCNWFAGYCHPRTFEIKWKELPDFSWLCSVLTHFLKISLSQRKIPWKFCFCSLEKKVKYQRRKTI